MASNVIQFCPRRPQGDARPVAPRTSAVILAEAMFSRLGTSDLSNYAVQHAVNGVLNELQRYWRADAERAVHDRLVGEIIGLRAEIARRDATDGTRPSLVHLPLERRRATPD